MHACMCVDTHLTLYSVSHYTAFPAVVPRPAGGHSDNTEGGWTFHTLLPEGVKAACSHSSEHKHITI